MNRNNPLPPLSAHPGLQTKINTNLYQSLLNQRFETPKDGNQNYILNEIKGIKEVLRKQYDNQNELQNKIIEYNKLISQQQNIIRLNNVKINEHDSKLTEVLLSFNNFLKFQEKTAGIVNMCQDKINNSLVNVKDFSDFKSSTFMTQQNLDSKLKGLYTFRDELLLKMNETSQENKNLQLFVIDKIKNMQNETSNSLSNYQSDNLKNFQIK